MAIELTCEALGVTPDEIADRVAQKVADRMLAEVIPDYDDETGAAIDTERPTRFQEMVRKRVARKIEQAVDVAAEKAIGAELAERLDNLRFPQTNGYGEKRGEPLTLLEFIAKRAGEYLHENVDSDGCPRRDSYRNPQPRVMWMIERWFASRVGETLTKAVGEANAKIVEGINVAVQENLADIAKRISAKVVVSSK